MTGALVLRGGRILDPATGIDMVGDVLVRDGLIEQIGSDLQVEPTDEYLDVTGMFVTPGFIDVHVHAFGPLGFASADSIGVQAGVTALCDAGGAAVDTFSDFFDQVPQRASTDVFSWLFVGPGGLDTGTADGRLKTTVRNKIPVLRLADLLDVMDEHGDTIVGIKAPAFGDLAQLAPLTIAKGVARLAERPLYVHIGDLQLPLDDWNKATQPVLDELTAGDVLTHCYTPCPGGLLDQDGNIMDSVAAALERGVLLDVGFGAFNFDFGVARTLIDKGVLPSTISSDLQQANVLGPVHSLAHVMSAFLALGMTLGDVILRVTANAAALINQSHRMGSLQVGRSADITVFEIENDETDFKDTVGGVITAQRGIVPRHTVKDGIVHKVELHAATQLESWSMNSVLCLDDVPPNLANQFDAEGRALLSAIGDALATLREWSGTRVHDAIRQSISDMGVEVGWADDAILRAFMRKVFPQAPGYLLGGLDRDFVVQRLRTAGASTGE